jgi:glutamate-1-semialdehyde aminotransferase
MNIKRSKRFLELSKRLIPGGNTFNKTSYFDQGMTPFALECGKGARVWDVDGNCYTDYILGLGSVTLGYRFNEMDRRISMQMKKGITFSLLHPLELQVAQKLTKMIPCAEMVRFGKNGSDVLSAAVRLSRYITGKNHIAFCGYHGWHDWCIAKTSRPGGIPKAIQRLSHKFVFNDMDSLSRLVKDLDFQVGCVVMDTVARYYPRPGFLEDVREFTRRHGIILIFDEIVTGFRIHKGGAQAFFNVIPDLACFGKALANGMPVSALVGKEKYMSRLDDLFFSLTFAGETLSLSAADAVLDIYGRIDVPADLHKKGVFLRGGLEAILAMHGLDEIFEMQGMPCRLVLGFKNKLDSTSFIKKKEDSDYLTAVLIREMAMRGILFNMAIFISYSHHMEDIKYFLRCFDEVCAIVKKEIGNFRRKG